MHSAAGCCCCRCLLLAGRPVSQFTWPAKSIIRRRRLQRCWPARSSSGSCYCVEHWTLERVFRKWSSSLISFNFSSVMLCSLVTILWPSLNALGYDYNRGLHRRVNYNYSIEKYAVKNLVFDSVKKQCHKLIRRDLSLYLVAHIYIPMSYLEAHTVWK